LYKLAGTDFASILTCFEARVHPFVLQDLFMFTRRKWLGASMATAAGAMAARSPILFGQNSQAIGRTGTKNSLTASPVSRLLTMLQQESNSEQVMQDVRTIWETDRWFTFPKFEDTAKSVAAIMRRSGLEDVEIGSGPADGVTQSGFWTMPLAWDITAGTLEIVDPPVPASARLLADYQRVPTSIGMWSGPTPKGGVTAEVVLAWGNWRNADLKGKLVLGAPLGSKRALAKAGALGLISEHTENEALLDERGWVNSFGDNGWSFTRGSAPLVCFSITPRQSALLHDLLNKGPVKVRANVDSRYYAGVYPYVTGVIRGTDGANAEEVLSLGHLFEQGANDNATGVSSIIGAAATLQRLIAAGKLPRPKRTIRVLGMAECYGLLHYLEQNKERAKRTAAAMCIDSPAGQQTLAGTEYTWVLNPQSAASYVDSFIIRVAAEYFPSVGRPWGWSEHRSGTDNYLGDPTIGIPTVLPRGGYGVHSHHNSHDTPALVDPKSLHNLMVMNAAYTYFIASAGPAEKRWLAELALTNGFERMAAAGEKILDQIAAAEGADRLGELLYHGREKIDYSSSRTAQAVHSAGAQGVEISGLTAFSDQQKKRVELAVEQRAGALGLGRIQPAEPKPNAEAEKIVVQRKRMSTITLDDLPQDEREGYPAASFWSVPVAALYWCDGKRNLAEVIRLTQLEMGPQSFDFVGYFKFLRKHGYVDLVG
jgi:hypothetical protein